MNFKVITIDLAKNVFQACGVNEHIKPQFNKKLKRNEVLDFMRQQAPTTVVMEACYSSHYWGRELNKLGHDVKLIPAQHVTPFVRGNKNDHNDAFAIAEASQRAHIRFVPVKSEHQQEISCSHRIRERLVKNKVSLSNQIRGLLSEFGVIFSSGHKALVTGLECFVGDAEYSVRLRNMMTDMLNEYKGILKCVKGIEQQLHEFVDTSENGQILRSIPGIGVINASAFLAAIDKGQAFNNPREFAVWLGLTPRQHASGNMNKMGGITKRGDRYLRKLLVHAGRSVVSRAVKNDDPLSKWATKLRTTKPFNQVAMAHRLARLIWILLSRQEHYRVMPAAQEA
ncbi:MAG: IS110 family transposase [Paraglaciecola sp.]|uniref:IS110 family transposase n=1 Tax=Paraglaciecola sp. TaxID=1920173 RepID=UPI00326380EA